MTLDELMAEIDPVGNPVKFDRTDAGLEGWMLFCVTVAGKGAKQTAGALRRFLDGNLLSVGCSPFEIVKYRYRAGTLRLCLEAARTGKYGVFMDAYYTLASQWSAEKLRTCSVSQLEEIPGVGPKTARFFLLSTRENAQVAALDTHLLKHLKTEAAARYLQYQGLTTADVPSATPGSKKLYAKLEAVVLAMAADAGMTPAAYDYMVWKSYYKGA
jgi:thermostable 8-oxoguanine DNA glycosylase